jgi:hypothetical protein
MTWLITPYMPGHRQLYLLDSITPEQITALVGPPKGPSSDGKCKYRWEFFAQTWTDGNQYVTPCAIWDYYDRRWSSFGPREVFQQLGLIKEPN